MDLSGNYSRNFQRRGSINEGSSSPSVLAQDDMHMSLQLRRLRLISDMMEDYQENMRRAFRLVGCELGISNNMFPNTITTGNLNVDNWLQQVYQATTDMYSPGGQPQEYERREMREEDENLDGQRPVGTNSNAGVSPIYSFNRSPPLPRQNIRRGFVYTQLLDPRDDPVADRGITNEQIASSTQLIQYDNSMNEARCPISLEYFESGQNILQINNCGHIFGHQPLMEWFQRNSRCPVCRTVVLSTNSRQRQPNNTPSFSTLPTDASGGINMRANEQVNINTSNVPSNSTLISQILSGILTSVNGAVNTETGYYESEFAFNVDDLLDAYTQLVGTQPSTPTLPSQNTNENAQ